MLEALNKKYLNFQDLDENEKQRRGILGRLYGRCADLIKATRNGRHYSDKLWEKVFQDPIVQEMIANGGIPGELEHPVDREEINPEKIAIMMPEAPKKDNEGHLIAYFDIIDTPCGRIAYQLAKYGFNLGISSRGSGDVTENYDGSQDVDPDTYEFKCFDLVLLPAVKNARLKMVESLNQKTFKQSLKESFEKSSEEDKKVMKETLKELNIDINSEKDEDKEEVEENQPAANNDGALMEQLQESLKNQETLELKVQSLQEKLSVCYAKEAKYEEELTQSRNAIANLSEGAKKAKELRLKVDSLKEQLNHQDGTIHAREANLKDLNEELTRSQVKAQSLKESLRLKNQRIIELEQSLREYKEASQSKEKSLKENLEEVKQNSAIKSKQYTEKLEKANQIVEHYKKVAKNITEKYIETKATLIGVSPAEISNRLNENYSLRDIDNVCEDLRSYKLNIAKLPFQVNESRKVKMKVTESKNDALKIPSAFDDTVDDDLIRLAEGITK